MNEVKSAKETTIYVPEQVIKAGILNEFVDNEGKKRYEGYWSYERENGWIVLSNQKLENKLGSDGDFSPLGSHKLRTDGRLLFSKALYTPLEQPEDEEPMTKEEELRAVEETTEQVVPSHVCVKDGEMRYFMSWSEWLHSDPKAAILFPMDDLPFKDVDDVPGSGGPTGPKFGGEGSAIEPPDLGLSD